MSCGPRYSRNDLLPEVNLLPMTVVAPTFAHDDDDDRWLFRPFAQNGLLPAMSRNIGLCAVITVVRDARVTNLCPYWPRAI